MIIYIYKWLKNAVFRRTTLIAKLLAKPEAGRYSALAKRIIIPFNRTLGCGHSSFWRRFLINIEKDDHLPRQARDRRKEKLRKEGILNYPQAARRVYRGAGCAADQAEHGDDGPLPCGIRDA